MSTLTAAETERLTRRGLRLAQFTVGYNLVEGAVAIAAGLAAGLVSLVGFGLDSGIESSRRCWSGSGWRPGCGTASRTSDENRRTLRLVAVTFFLPAAYVIIDGTRDLLYGQMPDRSIVGMAS